jgi:hypothetical protein
MSEILKEMANSWPSSVVARSEVKNFTGGSVSPKTLANADYKGTGPTKRFYIGKKACYPVESLIVWLSKKSRGIS